MALKETLMSFKLHTVLFCKFKRSCLQRLRFSLQYSFKLKDYAFY